MYSLLIYFTFFLYTIIAVTVGETVIITSKSTISKSNAFIKNMISKTLIFLISFTPILILTSLRGEVGKDYLSYKSIFEMQATKSYQEILFSQHFLEPIYAIENKFVASIFYNDYNYLLFLNLFLLFLFIYLSLLFFKNEFNLSIGLSILIFLCAFFPLALNIQRQMIAVAIVLFSYTYLYKNKLIPFVIYSLIAVGFHYSSIIGLLMGIVVMYLYPLNKKLLIVLILSVPFFFSIIMNVLYKIPIFANYLFKYDIANSNISLNNVFEVLFIFLPIILNWRLLLNKFPKIERLLMVCFFSVPLIFLASYQPVLRRAIFYVTILIIVVHPAVVAVQEDKFKKILWSLYFIGYYSLYFIAKYYIVGSESIFPFVF